MKRTQIQLPDALYAEVKRVAELQEWSISEVLRRGAEYIARCYPGEPPRAAWSLPEPLELGRFRVGHERWRELAEDASDRL